MNSLLSLALLAHALGQYCDSAGPTSVLDSNLGAVELESINDQTDCPGQQYVALRLDQSANLAPGKSYTLSYTVTTCGSEYPRVSAAWIDYNLDQVYSPDEMLAPVRSTSAGPDVISIDFEVPSDAVKGESRLRVMVKESSATAIDACDVFGYGAIKDFTIVIGNGGGGGGGTTFLILVFAVFMPVYLGGGCFYNYKVKGKRGMEMIPNIDFWRVFPGYVSTGCKYSYKTTRQWIKRMSGNEYVSAEDQFEEM